MGLSDELLNHRLARGGRSGAPPEVLTGLEWDGTAPGRRQLKWTSPLSAYDATYIIKIYQRDQVNNRSDSNRYCTTVFHGNDGDFSWGAGSNRSYYGFHPYPYPPSDGSLRWEVAANNADALNRDNDLSGDPANAPVVTFNRWYDQAFRATNNGGTYEHRFWIDLPSTSTADRITVSLGTAYVTPPTPILMIAQTPDNGGVSWGNYVGWEENNMRLRGIQIYASSMSESHIVALRAFESDSAVLGYLSSNGLAAPWYLNMNPTPSDVTDKSGSGHHPTWVNTNGAVAGLWTG